jgi:hypothetical protein
VGPFPLRRSKEARKLRKEEERREEGTGQLPESSSYPLFTKI